MKILLDTHFLLWLLFEPGKLKAEEKKLIQDPHNEVFVSALSLFEISLKYSMGRLQLEGLRPDEIPPLLSENGYLIEELNHQVFASFYRLPQSDHKDPFDRLLAWEAISKNLSLLTRDPSFKNYREFGLDLVI